LRQFFDAKRISVVNFHYPGLTAIQVALVKHFLRPETKLILSFHGMDIANAEKVGGFERKLWAWLFASADAIVGCSSALSKRIIAFQPRFKNKVVTIHNGLSRERLLADRDVSYALEPQIAKRKFILAVATFEQKKGLDLLIQAFALQQSLKSQEIDLVLVGVDRGAGGELRSLVERLGLRGRVHFFEAVPHARLHAFYSAATLFCLPSRSEPFGIVLLEAGAFGCAVIATAVGGIPEIITDGVTGKLVRPEDPHALAQGIDELLSSPETRARLAAALSERVFEHFTWTRAASQYLNLCYQFSERPKTQGGQLSA
jgi:glycosyltransferase involved in cell wall biosynthesis